MAQCDAGRKERRRRLLAYAILALTTTLLVSSCGLFMDEGALMARAAKERSNGDLRAAMLDLKNVLQKNPANAEARLALGEVSLDSGDFDSAILELEVARQRGAPADRVAVPLIRAYLSKGRAEDALKLAAEPKNSAHAAELLAYRGVALLSLQRPADARESFELSLKRDPKNIEALLGIASTAATLEGVPAALAASDRALKAAPGDPRVRILRGQLQMRANAPALAQKEFAKAVIDAEARKQGDQRFVALAGQAEATLAQSLVKESIEITQRMEQLRSDHPLANFMRARALLLAKRTVEARPLLEKNVGRDPEGAISSKLLLGAIALGDGSFGQAEMYLASVVAAAPDDLRARQLLADARMKQRKPVDALAALLPAVQGGNPNAGALAAAGKLSMAAGNTTAGLDYLERSLKVQPDDVAARLDLAAGYLSSGQADKAAVLLDSAPANTSNTAQHRYLKALTFLAKGDKAGAIQFVTSTAEKESQDASAQMLAGSVLASQQDSRARTYFERVIALKPEALAAYLSLARLAVMQGEPDAARAELTRAVAKSKGEPRAALAMADFELSQRQPEKALTVLDAALKSNPSFIEGRVRQVQILIGTGKLERAETAAQDALRLAPGNAAARVVAGDVQMARKQWRAAAATYAKANELQPSVNLAVRQYQALRQGSLSTPLSPLQKFVEEHPKDAAAGLALAQAAQETGDRKTAMRAYQSIIDSQPDNAAALAAALNNLAWLKHEDGDPAALGLAKRAYGAAPKDPRVVDTYAWLLVQSGQVKEGLALLAPIAGAGASEEIRIHYAQALAKAGRRVEARELGTHLASSTSAKISDEAKRLVTELDRG